MGNVFRGARKGLLKRLDCSTEKEAKEYVKKYHITQAPVMLYLDGQGNLLRMALGTLRKRTLLKSLAC